MIYNFFITNQYNFICRVLNHSVKINTVFIQSKKLHNNTLKIFLFNTHLLQEKDDYHARFKINTKLTNCTSLNCISKHCIYTIHTVNEL